MDQISLDVQLLCWGLQDVTNYLMNKYLISVPMYWDTTLGSEDTAKNKMNKSLLTWNLHSSVGRP